MVECWCFMFHFSKISENHQHYNVTYVAISWWNLHQVLILVPRPRVDGHQCPWRSCPPSRHRLHPLQPDLVRSSQHFFIVPQKDSFGLGGRSTIIFFQTHPCTRKRMWKGLLKGSSRSSIDCCYLSSSSHVALTKSGSTRLKHVWCCQKAACSGPKLGSDPSPSRSPTRVAIEATKMLKRAQSLRIVDQVTPESKKTLKGPNCFSFCGKAGLKDCSWLFHIPQPSLMPGKRDSFLWHFRMQTCFMSQTCPRQKKGETKFTHCCILVY